MRCSTSILDVQPMMRPLKQQVHAPQMISNAVLQQAETPFATTSDRCARLYQQGWRKREVGHSEAALRAFRELLIMGRQQGHQGWIIAAEAALQDLAVDAEATAIPGQESATTVDAIWAQRCDRAAANYEQGQTAVAIAAYEAILIEAVQVDERLVMARCLGALALIALDQQQYAQAEARGRAAVAILGDVNVPCARAIASHNLGVIYYQQGQFDKAQHSLQTALDHWQAEADSLGIALTLDYLGRLYARNQQGWLALGSFEAAIDVLNTVASPEPAVRTAALALLCQIANLCEHTQHLEMAIAYFTDALAIAQTLPNMTTQVEVCARLGRLHRQMGHWAIAQQYERQLARLS